MRLVEIEIAVNDDELPFSVENLLADAQRRIATLEEESRMSIPAFVPCDFALVHRALTAIKLRNLATGRRFLEWGSGIGVVTCLAIWNGFDAVGIEIEPKLVRIAEELAGEHGVVTEFACGSFVPSSAQLSVEGSGEITWLSTSGPDAYAQVELEPDDFDVIFAYPWPGEEQVIFDLFAECAAVGALLLTYHGQDGLRLHRKMRR
jgi:hypothetical protein